MNQSRGGDSSSHRAGRQNKSVVPAALHPDTERKIKVASFFRWDHENSKNSEEDIDILQIAVENLIYFKERDLNLDRVQYEVVRLYKNVLRSFYARLSTLSRLSELVYQQRGVNYSSNDAYIQHIVNNSNLYGIKDIESLTELKNIRDIRSFLDHPFLVNGTYDWITTSTIAEDTTTAVVVFYGNGRNTYQTGLSGFYKYMPDRSNTHFPIKADWYVTLPPLPVIKNAHRVTESIREFLITEETRKEISAEDLLNE